MNLALVKLITNETVICDLENLPEEPCYYLKNAYTYYDEGRLVDKKDLDEYLKTHPYAKIEESSSGVYGEDKEWVSWIKLEPYIEQAKENSYLFYTNKIVTMTEPSTVLVELYLKEIEKLGKK